MADIDRFERALIASGLPKKFLLDIQSVKVAVDKMIKQESKKMGA